MKKNTNELRAKYKGMKEATKLMWKRVRSGYYEASLGSDTYTVEDITSDLPPNEKNGQRRSWLCRLNRIPFDRASTLLEGKHWCEIDAERSK